MRLKLKNYTHNSELTIKQFIRLFLEHLCDTHSTFTEEDRLWCGKNNWRSIADITYICAYYYPESNYSMIKDVLHSFGEELVGHYCDDVEDRICSLTSKHNNWNSLSEDEEKDSLGGEIEYFSDEDASKILIKYKGHPYFSDEETSGIPHGVKIEHSIH